MGSSSRSQLSETQTTSTSFSLTYSLKCWSLLYRLLGFRFKITGSCRAATNLLDRGIVFNVLGVCFFACLCLIKTLTLAPGIPESALSNPGETLGGPGEKNQNSLPHCWQTQRHSECRVCSSTDHQTDRSLI